MSIELIYPFTTPGNYTFDSDIIEVSGGKAQLKDQRPADATFHANYDADINGNWGGGVLTGTPVGGAGVSGGKLDLAHNDIRYVDYNAGGNANGQQAGCIRFKFTPNYSGTPAVNSITPFGIFKAAGDTTNMVDFFHKNGNGDLYIRIKDQNDSFIIDSVDLGNWNPVSGIEYEFELNYDVTTGATRLFIDGIQFGSTQTQTGIRSADIGLLRIGSGSNPTNFEIDDLIIFDAVQHTANYTPGESIPATIYPVTDPQLVCNATFRHEGIEGFTETKSASGSDEIKYILKKGTIKYYWTGSAWAVSDGTYAQANTAAEIETNKATFTDIGVITEVTVFLHSDDGSTTPELDELQIDYDFSGSNPDMIDTCIVWGYQIQSDTDPDVETIAVFLVNDAVKYKDNITIMRESYTVTPDSNGYWEIELVETENMDGDQRYAFEIGDERFERGIPDAISANFYELT